MTKPTQLAPATPLPWITPGTDAGEYVLCSNGSKDKRRTVAHIYEPTDAAYIVHTCNTYPQLVAERQQLIEALHNAGIALHVISSKLKFTRNDGGEMANAVRTQIGRAHV